MTAWRGRFIFVLLIAPSLLLLPPDCTGIERTYMDDPTVSCIAFTGVKDDNSGYCVSSAGDVNGDGLDDILIGAERAIHNGNKVGKVYLMFGERTFGYTNYSLSNADVTFIGEGKYDYAGRSVSSAGDINGDGFDDILIGAHGNDDGGSGSGQVYIIFGKKNGWDKEIQLSNADASYIGESPDGNFGWSVSSAGDVNDDGLDDIIIGAAWNDDRGEDAGKIYLIFGRDLGWEMDMSPSSVNATFFGEYTDDRLGYHVNQAGDVNGDCIDDIIVGAVFNQDAGERAGKVYLIFGKKNGWNLNVNISTVNASFHGEGSNDYLGASLSDAGDINGDGYDDIIIGAHGREYNGYNSGKTYIIFGKEDGWSTDVNISSADASFIGEDEMDYSGVSVSSAGDVNDDGYDDIIIGAYQNHIHTDKRGKAYLILGKPSGWDHNVNLSLSDVGYEGEVYYDHFGWSVSNAGDVNGDDFDDIIIGASGNDDGGFGAGKSYLIFYMKNEMPNLTTNDQLFAEEDELYSVKYDATDDENTPEELKWEMITNATWLNFNRTTRTLSGTPDNGDIGSYWVNITVTDLRNGFDWTNFTLEVLYKNNPPEIVTDDIEYILEDSFYSNKYQAIDINPQNQYFTWNLTTDAQWLSFDNVTWYLNGTPRNEDVGTCWVNLTVMDDRGDIDWTNFSIVVENTNDAPEIQTIDNTTAYEDALYSVKYDAIDIDPTQDTLIWEFSTNADWLEFDKETGYLNGTPGNGDVGFYWVDISVSDGNGGSDHTNFTLLVVNVNDPPLIQNEDKTIAIEDEEYFNRYTAIDHDPTMDEINWTFSSNADWLDFNEITHNLTGISTNDDVGLFWVNITVSDDLGEMSFRNFTLEVQNTNDPPEITYEEMKNAVEDKSFNLQYSVIDIDPTGDVLTSVFKSNAGWLSFNETSWTISGVPGNGDAGTYWVNLTVMDDKGGISYSNITITVIGVNTAPEWGTFETSYEGKKGEPISIQVVATDHDIEDEIIYSLNEASNGIYIDHETGFIIWEDPVKGTHILNVSATDGNVTIFTSITLKITDDPDNGKITLSIILMAISVICIVVLLLMAFLYTRKKDLEHVPEE